jgi:hypothetical protein
MAWTNPRTWANAEIPTAALFNLHVRDNLSVIKAPFDNNAKIVALTAAYLADLNGSNLTGVALLAAGNAWTGGVQDFGGVLLRLPVGADKFAGAGGNKTAGSLWVEGTDLRHVGGDQSERSWTGAAVSTPGVSFAGFFWVEGNDPHYIDELGTERAVVSTQANHSDVAARGGSGWVDTDHLLHWIAQAGTTEWNGHADAPAHTDVPHSDSHSDTAHGDGGSHTDTHNDHTDHADAHTDTHTDSHSDVAHSDSHGDEIDPHFDTHGDAEHSDSHNDVAHADSHTDTGGHNDVHQDNAGSHDDVAHSDSHTDTHSDHTDVHADQPTVIGP